MEKCADMLWPWSLALVPKVILLEINLFYDPLYLKTSSEEFPYFEQIKVDR